jgi:hypothetical protein
MVNDAISEPITKRLIDWRDPDAGGPSGIEHSQGDSNLKAYCVKRFSKVNGQLVKKFTSLGAVRYCRKIRHGVPDVRELTPRPVIFRTVLGAEPTPRSAQADEWVGKSAKSIGETSSGEEIALTPPPQFP